MSEECGKALSELIEQHLSPNTYALKAKNVSWNFAFKRTQKFRDFYKFCNKLPRFEWNLFITVVNSFLIDQHPGQIAEKWTVFPPKVYARSYLLPVNG